MEEGRETKVALIIENWVFGPNRDPATLKIMKKEGWEKEKQKMKTNGSTFLKSYFLMTTVVNDTKSFQEIVTIMIYCNSPLLLQVTQHLLSVCENVARIAGLYLVMGFYLVLPQLLERGSTFGLTFS